MANQLKLKDDLITSSFSLIKAYVLLIVFSWIITTSIITLGIQSEVLSSWSHFFSSIADPNNWYNASVNYREQMLTIYAVNFLFIIIAFFIGFYCEVSHKQIESEADVTIFGRFFGLLFCLFILNYFLNHSGSENYIATLDSSKLDHTELLLNHLFGISVIITINITAAVNVAYLSKRMYQKISSKS